MIPRAHLTQWRNIAPWPLDEQVEQDIILSRALIELFQDKTIARDIAFRGGTAIHKVWLKSRVRYSEDIDLVQIKAGPIGRVMDAVRQRLDPWLGEPQWKQSAGRVTFYYQFKTEVEPVQTKRLKIEINTREHFTVQEIQKQFFAVNSRWWQGTAKLTIYAPEELLGTKLRALYQRKKGRDLFDLWYATENKNVNLPRVVECFQCYMEAEGRRVSRAQFEENLLTKLDDVRFLEDVAPLLAVETGWHSKKAGRWVIEQIAVLFEGDAWKGTS